MAKLDESYTFYMSPHQFELCKSKSGAKFHRVTLYVSDDISPKGEAYLTRPIGDIHDLCLGGEYGNHYYFELPVKSTVNISIRKKGGGFDKVTVSAEDLYKSHCKYCQKLFMNKEAKDKSKREQAIQNGKLLPNVPRENIRLVGGGGGTGSDYEVTVPVDKTFSTSGFAKFKTDDYMFSYNAAGVDVLLQDGKRYVKIVDPENGREHGVRMPLSELVAAYIKPKDIPDHYVINLDDKFVKETAFKDVVTIPVSKGMSSDGFAKVEFTPYTNVVRKDDGTYDVRLDGHSGTNMLFQHNDCPFYANVEVKDAAGKVVKDRMMPSQLFTAYESTLSTKETSSRKKSVDAEFGDILENVDESQLEGGSETW